MFAISVFRAACMATATLTTTLAVPAAAQGDSGEDYDLPAQALDETLRAIAKRAGREIIFTRDTVEGRRAPPIRGRLTFAEALKAALAGNALSIEETAGAVLIRERTQETDAAADQGTGTITVTGTRIRGNRSPSPVIVTTRSQLEEAGVNDLAGFTRVLPQNYTGGVNPGIAGGGQQGGQSNINNSAALNLRGLGPDATLTLINGHRVAYDALNQGVDIASIPLAAIERIEVIADGASALYGSDAVGGVANIILRRDFEGLETTARLGGSTGGGNDQQAYSAVSGHRWSSGGFMLALDHSRTTPIFADQRAYTSRLDPSLTLTQRNRQLSGVIAAHQRLTGGVTLEFDGYAAQRRVLKQTPFLPRVNVLTNGLVNRPEVGSYALTPTLRVQLPWGWQGSISGTHAVSRTDIASRRFFNGNPIPSRLIYENRTNAVEAGLEGAVFEAPGGPVRLAVGAGLRKIVLDVNVNQTIGGKPVTTRDFTDSRDVLFGYGELSVPVIGASSGVPLVHRLSLSAALRYERYRGIDEVVSPKLGFVYQPHADVTVRGSWGRAFKAPTLNQVNEVVQGALLPGVIFSPQPSPPLAPGASVLLIGGGNPNLQAERASSWSATLEFQPRFLEGLRLEGSYFDIDYQDRVGLPLTGTLSALANPLFQDLIVFRPTAAEVNALVATLPQGLSNQTGAPFNPANVGAIIDASFRNTARVRARGVDLMADYRVTLGPSDRLFLTGAASYLQSDQQLTLQQPVVQQAGRIFRPPHWRARAGAAWQGRLAGLGVFLNYVGSTRDNRFPDNRKLGSFVTLDVTASLRTGAERGLLRGFELRLSALNLLDKAPVTIRDPDPAAPPFDSTNQSAIGRFIGLSVRKAW